MLGTRATPRCMTLLVLACASCAGASTARPPRADVAAASASPRSIAVTYRAAANAFEIMDNVSSWWEGKCDPEYRAYWEQRFPVSPEDERAFRAYGEIRRRYYPQQDGVDDPRVSPHGLFAPRKAPDRFAEAFYASDTVTEALDRLRTFASADDVAAVQSFFAAFQSRVAVLLAESEPYRAFAARLEEKLNGPKVAAYVTSVARAYGVAVPPKPTVLFVWWPPVDHVTANTRGPFLLMKVHPVKHADEAQRDIGVVLHEVVHVVSAARPDAEKRALTDVFLRGCDVASKLKPVLVLEEPLAVAQEKLFAAETDPARIDYSTSWYGAPWVGAYAKMLVNLVGQHFAKGGTVDEALMRRSARLCAQLVAAGTSVAAGKKEPSAE